MNYLAHFYLSDYNQDLIIGNYIAIMESNNNTHEAVVFSVLKGEVDIGTIRTGVIEQLIQNKKLKRDDIKILNAHYDSLKTIHSTPHYPEWPFSVMPHVSTA